MTPPIPTEKADMNAKHTPGPWRVTPPDAGTETRENHLIALCVMKGNRLIARLTQSSHAYADPDELANAALIAAAPDLLEALEACTRWLDKEGPLPAGAQLARAADLERARAALAKASGAP